MINFGLPRTGTRLKNLCWSLHVPPLAGRQLEPQLEKEQEKDTTSNSDNNEEEVEGEVPAVAAFAAVPAAIAVIGTSYKNILTSLTASDVL